MALWDLAAKAANLPLFRFLGAYRTTLPVYASSLFLPEPALYVEQARAYAARGIRAYKAHPPGPWRRDMEVHRALRSELGPEHVLMTDPVAEYTLETAIRVGRDLERLEFAWFEEPFRDVELAKYARLCAALDIPIAATETTHGGPAGVAQAIAFGAVDIVRADVSWKPGVTGTLKIAHLAEAHGLQCELHATTMGITDIANLHVACAIRNCEYFELLVPEEPFRFPMLGRVPDRRGRADPRAGVARPRRRDRLAGRRSGLRGLPDPARLSGPEPYEVGERTGGHPALPDPGAPLPTWPVRATAGQNTRKGACALGRTVIQRLQASRHRCVVGVFLCFGLMRARTDEDRAGRVASLSRGIEEADRLARRASAPQWRPVSPVWAAVRRGRRPGHARPVPPFPHHRARTPCSAP